MKFDPSGVFCELITEVVVVEYFREADAFFFSRLENNKVFHIDVSWTPSWLICVGVLLCALVVASIRLGLVGLGLRLSMMRNPLRTCRFFGESWRGEHDPICVVKSSSLCLAHRCWLRPTVQVVAVAACWLRTSHPPLVWAPESTGLPNGCWTSGVFQWLCCYHPG